MILTTKIKDHIDDDADDDDTTEVTTQKFIIARGKLIYIKIH